MLSELLAVGQLTTSVLGGTLQIEQGLAGASIANQNAAIARQNAEAARVASREQARQIRYAGEKTLGQQRAAYGRAHLAGGGSLIDVLMDTATQYEFDAQKAIYAGEVQARGLYHEANMLDYQAKVLRRSSLIGGVTSALGGIAYGLSAYQGGYYNFLLRGFGPNAQT
jgi:hypothetical protein